MKIPWSISTTVRNPERLRNFLRVLKNLEGKEFTKEEQVRYQILLIKDKLYIPRNIPSKYAKFYYKEFERQLNFEEAKEIFKFQNYKDPAMRGRQSVNPLNKLGFSIAREKEGPIKITDLGNLFLEGKEDIGFIFFKSLLKLQFPNPWSIKFTEKNGFNVRPLIATFRLISELNKKDEKKGLSRVEFCLFIPTLINANYVDSHIKRIQHYRRINKREKQKFIRDFVTEFYEIDKNIDKNLDKKINTLYDYGDNIMRYFRLTKFFRIERDALGFNWKIDLEILRMTEINQILSKFNGEAFHFEKTIDYINYISNINEPLLPWEEIENLRKIAFELQGLIEQTVKTEKVQILQKDMKTLKTDIGSMDKNTLKKYISELRKLNQKIKISIEKNDLRGNKKRLNEIITILEDIKKLKKISPEVLEKILTEAFKIMNDEILIKPNYPMDDEGEPISHAPGKKPDIECYYESFKAIVEVTLNISNTQWLQEGQPVMRHLREFENRYSSEEKIYCIFLSPKIKEDSYSIFLYSLENGYDGKPQKIIPFTTRQFTILLKKILSLMDKNEKITHKELLHLYESIIIESKTLKTEFSKWSETIDKILNSWQGEKNEN